VLVCALLINPRAESGINDEWSYALTARVLADTGHFVYNGWAAPMLGWQGYLGALFIKLFGFSFSILRWPIILVAMATAFLLHRLLVRIGASEWNATVGTLAAVFSPLFMNMMCSFMTDMGALFSIVLCLYACVRALQARGEHERRWAGFASRRWGMR
jgi:4-amino-4-deoxy-L-arabinose transferase-like glycosyltransferase